MIPADDDPSIVLDLIEAFRRSKVMFTATRLGIFDQLALAPMSAVEISNKMQLNTDATTRLLDGCVSLGLLSRQNQIYAISPVAARYLVSSSPDTLSGYINYSDRSLYLLWSHLDDAVRQGTNRWEQTFGSRDALFAHFFRDEAAMTTFTAGMHGFGQIASRLVVRAFDLSASTHLVDLGGATGHLAIAACEAYPSLRATVLDLRNVSAIAHKYIDESHVSDRVRFIASDFFANEFPTGDLYVVGRILHDWGEARIHLLLDKIFRSLPSGGRLLIAETLVNEDRTGPVYALMQDLNMLVCTEGKERTPSQYRELLEAAGFSAIEYRNTGSLVDAVLATKR